MSKLFTKDPDEEIDLSIDWSDFLDDTGSPTDLISTSTWVFPTGSPSEITEVSSNIQGAFTTLFVAGGVAGELYRILNQIETLSGRKPERVVYVHIVDGSAGQASSSLIVEDGTVVAGANALVSRPEVSSYHAVRNNTAWFDATLPKMDGAIVQATDFLMQKYRTRWKGERISADQALDWPRSSVILEDIGDEDDDFLLEVAANIVPQDIKNAVSELALRALTGELNPDVTGGGPIKRAKAGSVEVEYFAQVEAQKIYRAVDDALKVYLRPRANRLIRG